MSKPKKTIKKAAKKPRRSKNAKVTITIKDRAGKVNVSVVFDPPIKTAEDATPAQTVSVGVLEALQRVIKDHQTFDTDDLDDEDE